MAFSVLTTAALLGASSPFGAEAPNGTSTIVTVDVGGIQSWDALFDDSNTTLSVDLAAALGLSPGSDVLIDGIGWDVTITTVGDSWLREARLAVDDSGDDTPELFLAPSLTAASGVEASSSLGILDLTDSGLRDITVAGGMISMEFFETFDNVADAVDATWTGTISFSVVPAPGALAMLGLAGLATVGRRRRA